MPVTPYAFGLEAVRGCLRDGDARVVGYPDNRRGRRAFERDRRRGKGVLRVRVDEPDGREQ